MISHLGFSVTLRIIGLHRLHAKKPTRWIAFVGNHPGNCVVHGILGHQGAFGQVDLETKRLKVVGRGLKLDYFKAVGWLRWRGRSLYWRSWWRT